MAKTMEEVLKGGQGGNGRPDPNLIKQLREDAQRRGLTKKVIHLELDLMSGNLQSQVTPMDFVTHIGMLGFYFLTLAKAFITGKASGPGLITPGGAVAQTAEGVAAPAANDNPQTPADPAAPDNPAEPASESPAPVASETPQTQA